MANLQKIVFVYNAKSGFMHSMSDLFRNTTKPSNNPCKLCSLTYSGAFMKKMWKEYVASLGIETAFLHKDEFQDRYPDYKTSYPVVLLVNNDTFTKLVSDNDFKTMNDLTDLIKLLSERLRKRNKNKKFSEEQTRS